MSLYINKKEVEGTKIVVDDMILTTHLPTTAGSAMLDGYMSPFEAEVVTRLKKEGYNVYAKANTGEFGIDLLGETSHYGVCTGQDGAVTNAVAEIIKSNKGECAVVLNVNGAPARAAALSGLCYIKPTYGTVSRYGVIPAACSGETVGVMADCLSDCRKILSVISGHDDKDGTSLPEEKCSLLKSDSEHPSIKKIAVAKSMLNDVSEETHTIIEEFKSKVVGVEFVEIDANELKYAKTAWNILMSAEVCNNVSKYDGVKYGHRSAEFSGIDELYTNSRTEGFGYLLKSTILFGSETLSEDNYMKVYDKALRMRRVLCNYFDSLFNEYDAVLLPVCSKTKYTVDDINNNRYISYDESLYTSPAMITGLPVVVVGGVQLIGKAFSENGLLDIANAVNKEVK